MKEVENRFGKGVLLEESDLQNKSICFISTACLSVTSDAASFIKSNCNRVDIFISSKPNQKTDMIIVLGCQVTDLAVLNDIKTAEKLHKEYPHTQIVMGGCLAYRFDIELPEWCKRIEALRTEYIPLTKAVMNTVNWENPFWVNKEGYDAYGEKSGSLFRNYYPLKIGAGCHSKCKYCTIRDTRGECFETDAFLQIQEFLQASENTEFDGIVLTSDSPTISQIKDWCLIAKRYNKPISFRNVEPQIANACANELKDLAKNGLLKIFHCPIQSNNEMILKAMNRSVNETFKYIDLAQELRKLGVYVATNIIIDYVVNNETFHNMPKEWLDENFDYWVWNPYFDGMWNRQKAEERFDKYILNR